MNMSYVQIENSSRAAAQSAKSSPGHSSPTRLLKTGPPSPGEKPKGAGATATSKNAAASVAAPKSSGLLVLQKRQKMLRVRKSHSVGLFGWSISLRI